jgi:EAL domain
MMLGGGGANGQSTPDRDRRSLIDRAGGASLASAATVEEAAGAVRIAAAALVGRRSGREALLLVRDGDILRPVTAGDGTGPLGDPAGIWPPRRDGTMIGVLKIDKSFVDGIAVSGQRLALVEGIIRLAGTLHLDVIAEGIEAEVQRDLLVSMGCQFGQGYLLAMPVAADQAEALVRVSRSLVLALPRVSS